MSLATRCAACGTVFRVVQDQLKVSEGWVRCGRCGEVFSALEGLFDLDRENAPAWTPSQRGALEPARAVAAPHIEPGAGAEASEAEAASAALDADSVDDTEIDTRTDSRLDTRVSERESAQDPDDDETRGPLSPGRADDDAAASHEPHLTSADAEDHADEAAPATPEFVRRAERDARWHTPRARALLVTAAVVLTLLLGLQWAVFDRDALAARSPRAAAWLAGLCSALGCRIEPLRRLEGLSVESSGLTQLDAPALVGLQVSLRNRDTVPLLMPAVDLALTDSRGQVVVRKVLRGSDFGPATPAQLPAGGELALRAVLDTGDRRVAGYSVEIFYP